MTLCKCGEILARHKWDDKADDFTIKGRCKGYRHIAGRKPEPSAVKKR